MFPPTADVALSMRSDESAVVSNASARRRQFRIPGRRDRLAIKLGEQLREAINMICITNYAFRIYIWIYLKNSMRVHSFVVQQLAQIAERPRD